MNTTTTARVGVNDVAAAYGNARSIPGACPHCSGPFSATIHSGACPRVKAIEYHPDGAVKRVELHPEPSPGVEGRAR